MGYFELAARLAGHLYSGGANSKTGARTPAECLRLAGSFVDEASGADMGMMGFFGDTAWCEFFHDVAWDVTAVILSPARSRATVLLATDTD
jgi:hypothetical protein